MVEEYLTVLLRGLTWVVPHAENPWLGLSFISVFP